MTIPPDVKALADGILADLIGWGQEVDSANIHRVSERDAAIIARAILAERERAAKIAESCGDTWSNSRDVDVALQEAAVDEKVAEIAAAIRSPALRLKIWTAAEHLNSEAMVAAYRMAAKEDGDPALIAAVAEDVKLASARRTTTR